MTNKPTLENVMEAITGLNSPLYSKEWVTTIPSDVLTESLKWIDNEIAKSERAVEGETRYNTDYLTDWYEVLYDEMESRAALNIMSENLTGKKNT